MCGIFGWAGRDPRSFNKTKLDLLGIMNEVRGKDSCGLTVDSEIFVGVDKEKLYRDWLTNVNYVVPQEVPIVIGHTRAATGGAHNVDNAHPFGFGNNKDIYNFIGVHNGTLLNENTLAYSRGIETTLKKEKEGITSYRNKIDSEILLECLYRDQNFTVLSEYLGAAALVWFETKNPNIIYVYHGASKLSKHEVKEYIERPLFFYKESKYSLYISSLEESLLAIGGNEETVAEFECNKVYKITNGDISTALKVPINRSECYQKVYSTYNHNDVINEWYGINPNRYDYKKKVNVIDIDTKVNLDLKTLKIDQNKFKGKVYEHQLRYWRNGNRINGIYVWVRDYGFYFLGTNVKESMGSFWNLTNKYFSNGAFHETKVTEDAFIPFIHNEHIEIKDPSLHYFIKGIRVKTLIDYNSIYQSNVKFSYESLSICSCHPIGEISKKKTIENLILLNDTPYTGKISPLGSTFIYNISQGKLLSVTEREQQISPIILLPERTENNINVKTVNENIINDRLEEDLEGIFLSNYKKFPSDIKKLKTYNNDKSKLAIEILENFIKDSTALIALESNN